MRIFRRVLIGLVVVVGAAGAYGLLHDRPDREPHRSSRATSAPSTVPTTRAPNTLAPTTRAPTTLAPTTTTTTPGMRLPLDPRPLRIAWAGDSVAFTLRRAMAAEANARGVQLVDRSVAGCGMIRGLPADDNLVPIGFVTACDGEIPGAQWATAGSGADVVTWLSSWETSNRLVDGAGYVFGTPEADAKILALIDESVRRLTSGGARLVFLLDPPPTSGRIRPSIDPQDVIEMAHLNDLLRRYSAAHADQTAVLDLTSIVCPGGSPCPTEVDGITLRPEDGGHFSEAGAAYVAPRLADLLLGPA